MRGEGGLNQTAPSERRDTQGCFVQIQNMARVKLGKQSVGWEGTQRGLGRGLSGLSGQEGCREEVGRHGPWLRGRAPAASSWADSCLCVCSLLLVKGPSPPPDSAPPAGDFRAFSTQNSLLMPNGPWEGQRPARGHRGDAFHGWPQKVSHCGDAGLVGPKLCLGKKY